MYWQIVLISGLLTFVTILLTHKKLSYVAVKVGKYKIHHSVFGLLLIVIGRIADHSMHNLISSAGLGMYISHIFEEWAFNKIRFSKAIFIFITPLQKKEKSNT